MQEQILFETNNLTKCFGDNEATNVTALNKVDVVIKKGEFTSIVGPSGSGKSTLLNLLSGLDIPTGGSIKLNGTDLSKMSGGELSDFRRDHIGFVFQSYNLIPVLTVKENIEYIMVLQGKSESERRQRVEEVLADVGLDGMANRFPKELSGGQQQRVAVARAIAANPDIVLADEPTANLDSKTGTELVEMMKKLNTDRNITFIFSTHDPIIMERASRLIVLKDGQIVEDNK
jgi:putative ABC transport system ATP-binding protein